MLNSRESKPVSIQVGYDMTRLAAKRCFEAAGLKPSDVDVIELHDCFSANELITYEALGLCEEGKAGAPAFYECVGAYGIDADFFILLPQLNFCWVLCAKTVSCTEGFAFFNFTQQNYHFEIEFFLL